VACVYVCVWTGTDDCRDRSFHKIAVKVVVAAPPGALDFVRAVFISECQDSPILARWKGLLSFK